MLSVQECVDRFQQVRARAETLEDQLRSRKRAVEEKKAAMETLVKARWVLTEVAKLTQQKFQERVEGLVTLALRSVYRDEDYRFVLQFERKRNQLEVRPLIMEGENELVVKDDMGGGAVDICAFALRVVLWSLQKPRSRPVIWLDEPFKWLGSLIVEAGQMVKEISHKLQIQFVIATHDVELMEIADRAWHINKVKGVSEVRMIGEEKERPQTVRIRRRK